MSAFAIGQKNQRWLMLADDPKKILNELTRVRDQVIAEATELMRRWEPMLRRGDFRASAENFAHYMALRRIDVRPVQAALAPWGLASLGRCESRVMPTLNAIIANLQLISHANSETLRPRREDFLYGEEALHRHSEAVLGPKPAGRETRILVTLSARAAEDPAHVQNLVLTGMNCARINCAHDGPDAWAAMIANVRATASANGRSCLVVMDLAGPKIRTRYVVTPPDRKRVAANDRIFLAFGKPIENSEFAFQTSCTMPSVMTQVAAGAAASIKDGLIQGVIDDVREDGLIMRVLRTPPEGQPLQKEKGINFPGTGLRLSPLTPDDLANLDFVTEHADVVSYSFVQEPKDIALLQGELLKRRPGRPPMPIVAKIETQLAFDNLPDLIVQAAGDRHPPAGFCAHRIKTDPGRLDPEQPGDEHAQQRRADQDVEQRGRAEIDEQDGKQERGRAGADLGEGRGESRALAANGGREHLAGDEVGLPRSGRDWS
jgi:pyruvate kinase